IRCSEAPRSMLVAMALAAAVCIFNGSYPWLLYSVLPFPVDYQPYTAAHVLTQCQLLFFSALAFVWLNRRGLYPPELPSTNLDVEWTYRKLLPAAATAVGSATQRGSAAVVAVVRRWVNGSDAERVLARWGLVGSTWTLGTTALWALVLLTGYVFALYL